MTIHAMDIRKTDLNLLLVFDAMHQHRHVTRAGEALGLSQPAMSAALGRLRTLFGDPLFVRSGTGMTATPRAEALAPSVRQVVQTIASDILQPTGFDPQTSQHAFTLLTPDIAEVNFLPRLLAELSHRAPQVQLRTTSMPRDSAATSLEGGHADLAIGYFPDLHKAGFFQQKLFATPHVCVLRKKHPEVGARMTMAQFMRLSHAVVRPNGREHVFEQFLQQQGLVRPIAVELSHFMSLLPIVEGSDVVATVPLDLAEFFVRHGQVRYVDTPMKSPVIPVHMFWHQRFQKDPAHEWLRQVMHRLFSHRRVDGRS